MTPVEVLVAAAILVGLVGTVVPVLPGPLLVGAAIVAWAVHVGGVAAWLTCAAAVALLLLGVLLKYVVPGRRFADAGVPTRTLWLGAGLGVVGFFVVPVVGLFLGFVLGVWLAERRRVGDAAGRSTATALRAVALSVAIELTASLLAAGTWVVGVVLT